MYGPGNPFQALKHRQVSSTMTAPPTLQIHTAFELASRVCVVESLVSTAGWALIRTRPVSGAHLLSCKPALVFCYGFNLPLQFWQVQIG